MNLDEKIVHIQEAAMNEARSKANAIISQHREALEKLFDEHKRDAERQSEIRIKSGTLSARTRLNKAMADVQINIKREEGKCQNALKAQLFEEVEALMDAYMKTDAYADYLAECITKSASYAKHDEITIFINASDAHLKDMLEEKTGMALTISEMDFTGGVRAVVKARNILIDHSFKTALEEERRNFLIQGGDQVV